MNMDAKRKQQVLDAEMEWAKVELLLETLETRKRDGLDFHDVAVWCLRDALEAAFNAGVEQGRKTATSDKANN